MFILLFFILGVALGLEAAAVFGRKKNLLLSKLMAGETIAPVSALEDKIWYEEESNFLIKLNSL